VGECFFWYRLTPFVPDKIQRAVKWLCVCVCVLVHAHVHARARVRVCVRVCVITANCLSTTLICGSEIT